MKVAPYVTINSILTRASSLNLFRGIIHRRSSTSCQSTSPLPLSTPHEQDQLRHPPSVILKPLKSTSTSLLNIVSSTQPTFDVENSLDTTIVSPSLRRLGETSPSSILLSEPYTNSPHTSLSSFLQHARATSLSPSSTVFRGTFYEYLVLSALQPFGFQLTRVGQVSDKGIDLLGYWTSPFTSATWQDHKRLQACRIPIIIQCKYYARKLLPHHVRELEGAMADAPPGWDENDALGLLVAPGSMTRGVRERIRDSKRAVGFVSVNWDDCDKNEKNSQSVQNIADTGDGSKNTIVKDSEEIFESWERWSKAKGKVKIFYWNWKAGQGGLNGVGVHILHRPLGNGTIDREIVLTNQEET